MASPCSWTFLCHLRLYPKSTTILDDQLLTIGKLTLNLNILYYLDILLSVCPQKIQTLPPVPFILEFSFFIRIMCDCCWKSDTGSIEDLSPQHLTGMFSLAKIKRRSSLEEEEGIDWPKNGKSCLYVHEKADMCFTFVTVRQSLFQTNKARQTDRRIDRYFI